MSTTHITVLLDETGSMHPLRDETVASINGYFEDLKGKVQKGKPMRASLITFNSMKHQTVYEDTKIKDVPKLALDDYLPNHFTPLYDSLMRAIKTTDTKLKDNDRALMVIVTDGQENASRDTSLREIQQAIAKRTEAGNWTFVYIGAHSDTWAEAASMGIPVANTVAIPHTSDALRSSSQRLSRATSGYYGSMAMGSSSFFDPDDEPEPDPFDVKAKKTKPPAPAA